jgi:hypothetical protein
MRRRSALTGRSTDETDIGSSFHDEGNSMLKALPRLAQDSRENALPCPQWQSREAGSCLGALLTESEDNFLASGHAVSTARWRAVGHLTLGVRRGSLKRLRGEQFWLSHRQPSSASGTVQNV